MLRKLAHSYGVQTSYLDVHGEHTVSNPESVLAVLQTLGAPLARLEDADDAFRQRRRDLCRRVLPPVVPLWDDGVSGIRVTLPAEVASRELTARLYLEDGNVRDWSPTARTVLRLRVVDGEGYITTRLPLPTLPLGYHRLTIDVGGVGHETLLIRAPTRSFRDPAARRRWGLFAPIYAIRSRDSKGVGDFTDLARLMRFTAKHGGELVSTLPLYASFPEEPSPYSPMSRLFWNELYVDTGEREDTDPSGGSDPRALLDFPALFEAKRAGLASMDRDHGALQSFQSKFPLALDFARFRAFMHPHGTDWSRWPQRQREGVIDGSDVDEEEVLYHLFNQLRAEHQLKSLRDTGTGLYLDLPLGVHRHGYDTWRERALFATGADVGAPPDAAFPGGQNWSTPPVLPHESQRQGHRYLRRAFRHAMRHASLLRIDHIMGLHRQFWIPQGADVADGVYVRYPAEELYAILTLESLRTECELIGENLGIVPDFVNIAMRRHGLRGLYVMQLTPDAPIPEETVASLNTHDTATFAGHAGANPAALQRALSVLLASRAEIVNIALEDLWLEPEPHNVPGTTSRERPENWRRPMRHSLEELEEQVGSVLDGFQRD